eukprot:scaffold4335_cov119-Cylindrotheca_fusiformis.AAC.5
MEGVLEGEAGRGGLEGEVCSVRRRTKKKYVEIECLIDSAMSRLCRSDSVTYAVVPTYRSTILPTHCGFS